MKALPAATSADRLASTVSAGILSGGVGVATSVSVATTSGAVFSWYNYANYGIGFFGPAYYPWNCASKYSFYLGYSSAWGIGCASFGWGSPYWWCYPSAYWASPWWGYAAPYPAYYAPVYWAPSYASSVVYYPVPYQETVYVPAEQPSAAPVEYEPQAPVVAEPAPVRLRETDAPIAPPRITSELLADRYVALGDLYFRIGRYDRAVETYRKAIAHSERDANLRFILSDALFAVGSYSEASREIREAIRLDPTLVESRADKRSFYGVLGDFDAHVERLLRWLERDPTDGDAWLVLGYNRYFRGELGLARECFDRAALLLPAGERRAAELFLASTEVRIAENAASAPDPAPASAPAGR